ncbi:MAG: hypothetical protein PHS60_13940 [Zavarzinia sp.]|nr:hypothetical protein [Zavarzinia sp.]
MRKLSLNRNGCLVEESPSAIFEVETMSTGKARIALSVPDDQGGLFARLVRLLPPPFYVLYILHTTRGEGETGRYQSDELSAQELSRLLDRYASFFAGDGRHDLWVHSPGSGFTLVWDRHNFLFVEGEPLDDIRRVLMDLGFHEGRLEPLEAHAHHYRAEFDEDAASLLDEIDWHRTPLRPEDVQW